MSKCKKVFIGDGIEPEDIGTGEIDSLPRDDG